MGDIIAMIAFSPLGLGLRPACRMAPFASRLEMLYILILKLYIIVIPTYVCVNSHDPGPLDKL